MRNKVDTKSSRSILRTQIEILDRQVVELPESADFCYLAPARHGKFSIDLWYAVTLPEDRARAEVKHSHEIRIFGTGHEIPPGWVYLGTAVMFDDFVWHVFHKGGLE